MGSRLQEEWEGSAEASPTAVDGGAAKVLGRLDAIIAALASLYPTL